MAYDAETRNTVDTAAASKNTHRAPTASSRRPAGSAINPPSADETAKAPVTTDSDQPVSSSNGSSSTPNEYAHVPYAASVTTPSSTMSAYGNDDARSPPTSAATLRPDSASTTPMVRSRSSTSIMPSR
ncbi:hypothetical protein [Ilumatobacter fluminis]|uniref:hypothetical protein n=1 Tax=Ilumatobacter fluminis TaxID=467091 RepID=UPI00105D0AEE|nr:hypothetical protein [Ilumatobacter fluminis]